MKAELHSRAGRLSACSINRNFPFAFRLMMVASMMATVNSELAPAARSDGPCRCRIAQHRLAATAGSMILRVPDTAVPSPMPRSGVLAAVPVM